MQSIKKIRVEDIVDAMILAKDACSPAGNVLLSKGTALTPFLGRRLKNWGILFVDVESDKEPIVPEAAPFASNEEFNRNLMNQFSAVIDSVLMKRIFDVVLRYKLKKDAQQA